MELCIPAYIGEITKKRLKRNIDESGMQTSTFEKYAACQKQIPNHVVELTRRSYKHKSKYQLLLQNVLENLMQKDCAIRKLLFTLEKYSDTI